MLKKIKPTRDAREAAKTLRAVAEVIKDQPGFCIEVMALMKKVGGNRMAAPLSNATLRDVRIEGDKAAGTLSVKKGEKEAKEPIAFTRINGGWRLVAPEPNAPTPQSRPAPPG